MSSEGMSPRRLAMVRRALGSQEEEERESSVEVVEVEGRSSERMALDWVRAVGSTGSLISSWTSAGVRGVSMVNELIGVNSNENRMVFSMRLSAIDYGMSSCMD